MRRIVLLVGLFVVLLFVLGGIPASAGFIVDWWWFRALGFQTVFLTQVGTKMVVGGIVAVLTFAFLYVNVRIAQRGMGPDPLAQLGIRGLPRLDLPRLLHRFTGLIAAVLALLVGLASASGWLTVQRFLHRTAFGVTDPVFGRDVGYYVFTLPFVSGVVSAVLAVTFLALLIVIPLYVLRRGVIVMRGKVRVIHAADWHLAALLALIFVTLAVNTWLVRVPMLLYGEAGPMYGASFTDLSVQRPAMALAVVVALAAAGFVLYGAYRRRVMLHLLIGTVAYLGVGVVAGLIGVAVQRLIVIPNELVKESPQLEHHIAATRAAWGLDDVVVRPLSGESAISAADVEANRGTINNVRLWDRDPLLQTFGQLQEIRTYYDFISVDDDRYWIDGEYRQVLLSPRELNPRSLPTRTFINERLRFTHGMGLTLSPVNQISREGLPVLFVKDLPPASSVSLQVTRPGIYYGEMTSDYVFVRTSQEEFDYPSGDGDAVTTYDGTGGVSVGSWFRRMLISMRFGSMKIFLSQDITEDSRVMFRRSIRERASTVLPFLHWDTDPYIVIREDGRLAWILDAYTTTSWYPYAQPVPGGVNYMRNSVKVVIDAYDGDVQAYVADPSDPLARTYSEIFAGVLHPLSEMPADLRAHIRYPEDIFRLQTELYATYHMGEPEVFYHREDEWQKPAPTRGDVSRDPFLRHIILKLPGEDREEYIVMTPFTPRGKDNLSAWMIARNDGDRLGELVVYRFPRQSLVFGPTQVVNRINQDTEISQQISLWDQRGSEVIRGNLLVIPIEESLVFVQALYLRAEGGRIPELKRVIVAYENQVVMEETLEAGLARLFGGGVSTPRPTSDAVPAATTTAPTVLQLIQEANRHYEQAMAAQRAGDWALYGEEMRLVGEALRALRTAESGGETP